MAGLAVLSVVSMLFALPQREGGSEGGRESSRGDGQPCTFLDTAGHEGVNGTRWCRSTAVEEYRLCPRRASGDVACQTKLAPRPTVDAFRRLLAGKHIVFMGDSRVRYQYMNLVDALVHGDFMRCQDYKNVSVTYEARCFLIDHTHHHDMRTSDWTQWYARSNAAFNDEAGDNKELCDCFRPTKFDSSTTYENRHFLQHSEHGVIRLTFLENFVDLVRFHQGFPPYGYNGRAPCDAGSCGTKAKYAFNTADAVREVVPLLKATHVFAQTGWKHLEAKEGFNRTVLDIGCTLVELERTRGIRGFYITHTDGKKGPTPKLGCGLDSARVLDRLTATTTPFPRNWLWDKQHVLGILNQHYNELLLHAIQVAP